MLGKAQLWQQLQPALEIVNSVKFEYIHRDLFEHYFKEEVQNSTEGEMDLEQLKCIFFSIATSYEAIVESIGSMKMKLRDIREYCQITKSTQRLIDELKQMVKGIGQALFFQKVRCYVELMEFREAAEILLLIRSKCKLGGTGFDFQQIYSDKGELTIDEISADLNETVPPDIKLTKAQRICLQEFVDNHELVELIQENVEDGQNINNFLELARDRIGREEMPADAIIDLRSVLNYYSPLIFGLKNTDGRTELLKKCGVVFENMKQFPDLPEQMRHVGMYYEALKQAIALFGDMEQHAIQQAGSINDTGRYRIGRIANKADSEDLVEELDEYVMLEYSHAAKDTNRRTGLSFSKLNRLQSKLTLIEGKHSECTNSAEAESDKKIERFRQVKDCVEKLARAYLDLVWNGCVQFDDLLMFVNCNDEEPWGVQIRWKQLQIDSLDGKNDNNLNIGTIDHCQAIYKVLQECITSWTEKLNSVRQNSPAVNLYTTSQLVKLRRHLALSLSSDDKQGKEDHFHKVGPLLAMTGYLPDQIEVLSILEEYETQQRNCVDTSSYWDIEYSKLSKSQQMHLNRMLLLFQNDRDWTKNVVMRAFHELRGAQKEYPPRKHYETWFRKYQKIPRNSQEDDTSSIMAGINHHARSTEPDCLGEKLRSVLHRFDQIAERTVKDFLGTSHLVCLLDTLYAKHERTQRDVPIWLRDRKQPSLIPVEKGTTYKALLTIYAADCSAKPPSSREVLICHPDTTVKQVDLFLKRAYSDELGFYCLANCHFLSSAICKHVWLTMNTLKQQTKNDGSRIALIYDVNQISEAEKVPPIRSYLSKLLVNDTELADLGFLRKYIQGLLLIPVENCDDNAASRADDDRCFARVIVSRRAGVGKSLQVERRIEKLWTGRTRCRTGQDIILTIHQSVENEKLIKSLVDKIGTNPQRNIWNTIHIDIAHEVAEGVDELLFNLLITGSLEDSKGEVWLRNRSDYYVIECMPHTLPNTGNQSAHELLRDDLFPSCHCIGPDEAIRRYMAAEAPGSFVGIDSQKLASREWRRVNRCLLERTHRDETLTEECTALTLLVNNCGVDNPSWRELSYFVSFLYQQLICIDNSPYIQPTGSEVVELPLTQRRKQQVRDDNDTNDAQNEFIVFAEKFMLAMAKDFATRSLKITEQAASEGNSQDFDTDDGQAINGLKFKDQGLWKDKSHPYLFINEDGVTISTFGFCIKPSRSVMRRRNLEPAPGPSSTAVANDSHPNTSGLARQGFLRLLRFARTPYDLINQKTKQPYMKECISHRLMEWLKRNYGKDQDFLIEDSKGLEKKDYLQRLRKIMVKNLRYYMREPSDNVSPGEHVRTSQIVPYGFGFPKSSGTHSNIKYIEMEEWQHDDPDPEYMLTDDNARKILGIHKRIQANIPVVIMGETGCGKTKLIEYMSKLQVPPPMKDDIRKTLLVMKVHGGTTAEQIKNQVRKAQKQAKENHDKCLAYAIGPRMQEEWEKEQTTDQGNLRGYQEVKEDVTKELTENNQIPEVYTILFFDEANTTEAVGLIKEIMCDNRMDGEGPVTVSGLRIVAACNPYKLRNKDAVSKLELAGLNQGKDEQDGKTYGIPMRKLVYRVQPLPEGLLPLVMDFGAVTSEINQDGVLSGSEQEYIAKMISNHDMRAGERKDRGALVYGDSSKTVTHILTRSQIFMRNLKDECSFVSLRDILRFLDLAVWFHAHPVALDDVGNKLAQSVCLALSVCYLAKLDDANRKQYLKDISKSLGQLINRPEGKKYMNSQFKECKKVFIDKVIPDTISGKGIAKNSALSENVFMMIICIQNKIPLFLVGKPGSSKSLAKTLVFDALQGPNSNSDIFRNMTKTHMISYQCSGHSTQSGITAVFNEAAGLMKRKPSIAAESGELSYKEDKEERVSVVVLDEIGLAETSKHMPLKALHSLLEDGVPDASHQESDNTVKCGFIGISNWALDPAKMNRGVFVQRTPPENRELEEIAMKICEDGGSTVYGRVPALIRSLADGYKCLCDIQDSSIEKKKSRRDVRMEINREFFGLRDYYSLIKMIVRFTSKDGKLTSNQLEHCIRRNFSGLEHFDVYQVVFKKGLPMLDNIPDDDAPTDSCLLLNHILSPLQNNGAEEESRYLLIIAEDIGVRRLVIELCRNNGLNPEVVHGSGFSGDKNFTQICRDIYQIKICMADGRPVVLLNLDDLYESLYDTMNQYFYHLSKDKKYIGLGLGLTKVKTPVRNGFRLIVVADQNSVDERFPTPLLNRLEKHYVSPSSVLNHQQLKSKKVIENWVVDFGLPFGTARCPLTCVCGKQMKLPHRLPCAHYMCKSCVVIIVEGSGDRICKQCQDPIPNDFPFVVDDKAHKRWMRRETSMQFVGFAQETIPLIMIEVSKDPQLGTDHQQEEAIRRCKYYLLKCAAPDAVLRLEKTVMSQMEIKSVVDVYFGEQAHENLADYLGCVSMHMTLRLHQVTTFAPILNDIDIQDMKQKTGKHIELMSLKLYSHRDQFVKDFREFISTSIDHEKVIVVQCEAAFFEEELLNTVRYEIEKETSVAGAITSSFHVVLLLNLQRSQSFTGFQGDRWSCVHIDDPRLATSGLPATIDCTRHSCSKLLRKLAPGTGLQILSRIMPEAVSVIKGYNHTLKQSEMKVLFERHDDFANIVLKHMQRLLEAEESAEHESHRWVKQYAIKQKTMKETGTLRSSIEAVFLARLKPVLATVLSRVDINNNTNLVNDPDVKKLFLDILEICEHHSLSFEDIQLTQKSSGDIQALPATPDIATLGMCQFDVKFPFSWILKEQIDRWLDVTKDANTRENAVYKQLQATELGKVVLKHFISARNTSPLFDRYLIDFIYMAFPCKNDVEHRVVASMVMKQVEDKYTPPYTAIQIHLAYAQLTEPVSHLVDFFNVMRHLPGFKLSTESSDGNFKQRCDHVFASEVTDYLEERIVSEPEDCVHQVERCKTIVVQILSSMKDSEEKRRLSQKWETTVMIDMLFIRHVVKPTGSDHTIDLLPKLHQVFEDVNKNDKDMTYNKIVEFMRLEVSNGLLDIYHNSPTECPGCGTQLTDPMKLFCGHYLCKDCLPPHNELCKDCGKEIPADFKYDLFAELADDENEDQLIDFRKFRDCMNIFFMRFLSEVIFVPGYIPSVDIVERIFGFISVSKASERIRVLSCASVVLPSPVVNSFLLKLLLKYTSPERDLIIKSAIQQHLASKLGSLSEEDGGKELQMLMMDCFKDAQYNEGRVSNHDIISLADNLERIQEWLVQADANVFSSDFPIQLRDLSNVQMAVTSAVHVLLRPTNILSEQLQALRSKLKHLLNMKPPDRNRQLRYYVLRQLLTSQGFNSLSNILAGPHSYMIPDELADYIPQSSDTPIYIKVIDKSAHTIATESLKGIFSGDTSRVIANDLNSLAQIEFYEPYILNAAYSLLISGEDIGNLENDTGMNELVMRLEGRINPSKLKLLKMLVGGTGTLPKQMDVRNTEGRNLIMLIINITNTLCKNTVPHASGFINPLTEIIRQPLQAMQHFLPTMPEDGTKSLPRDVMDEAYNCPNGHECVITMGQNTFTRGERCTFAGCEEYLQLPASASGHRRKKKIISHNLGPHTTRPSTSCNVRDLSPLSSAVLRCIVHLAMYTSSLQKNAMQVVSMIGQDIDSTDELQEYIYGHVLLDIQQVAESAGETIDSSLVLIHEVINKITYVSDMSETQILKTLDSNAERRAWEKDFDEQCIQPVFANKVGILEEFKEGSLSSGEDRNEKRLLGRMDDMQTAPINHLFQPWLWRYTQPLTLEYVKNKLSSSSEKCASLKEMIQHSDVLPAVKCLPSIMKLAKVFGKEFRSQLSRQKIESITLETFIRKLNSPHRDEIKALTTKYMEAWNLLVDFPFFRSDGIGKLDDKSPISRFLHYGKIEGRTSSLPLRMIEYLYNIHNTIIKSQELEDSLPKVSIDGVTSFNIVSLEDPRSLLVLIQSYSKYIYHESDVEVSYDMESANKEIQLIYITNKPLIDFKEGDVPCIVFKEDFTLSTQFLAIQSHQVRLSKGPAATMLQNLTRCVPTLRGYLTDLQVILNILAINPLPVVWSDSLHSAMMTAFPGSDESRFVYLMDNFCLKHIKHIWLIVKYTQADEFMRKNKPPFDDLTNICSTSPLSQDQETSIFESGVAAYKGVKTSEILFNLFEYIILVLNKERSFTHRSNEYNMPLQQAVEKYFEKTVHTTDEHNVQTTDEQSPVIPDDIHVRHAQQAWGYIWRYFTEGDTADLTQDISMTDSFTPTNIRANIDEKDNHPKSITNTLDLTMGEDISGSHFEKLLLKTVEESGIEEEDEDCDNHSLNFTLGGNRDDEAETDHDSSRDEVSSPSSVGDVAPLTLHFD